jgi:hypothetical protein
MYDTMRGGYRGTGRNSKRQEIYGSRSTNSDLTSGRRPDTERNHQAMSSWVPTRTQTAW